MGLRGLRARATSLLSRVANGEPIEQSEAHEFARAWLAEAGAQIALALLTGQGPDARLLTELCVAVLTTTATDLDAPELAAAGGAS